MEVPPKAPFISERFCKNQHIPAPAMDEFEIAMRLSKQVVLALYPVARIPKDPNLNHGQTLEREKQLKQDAQDGKIPQPIVLTRIWCLFEINMK